MTPAYDEDSVRAAVFAELRGEVQTIPACWSWPAPETCTFKDDDTAEQFLSWWHWEQCAICGTTSDLVKDHDHRTALVRGYLCRSCNKKEGHAAADDPLFKNYRERSPAVILGIQVTYWSPVRGEARPQPQLTPEEEREQARLLQAAVDRLNVPVIPDAAGGAGA
jgi:Recombination endonuclease VII